MYSGRNVWTELKWSELKCTVCCTRIESLSPAPKSSNKSSIRIQKSHIAWLNRTTIRTGKVANSFSTFSLTNGSSSKNTTESEREGAGDTEQEIAWFAACYENHWSFASLADAVKQYITEYLLYAIVTLCMYVHIYVSICVTSIMYLYVSVRIFTNVLMYL